jgi:hypothetical protein
MSDAIKTRNHATVAGETSSNKLIAMIAPVYWAIADSMKKSSGGAALKIRSARNLSCEVTKDCR